MCDILAFLLGLLPPFSSKKFNNKITRNCNRIIENECARLTILNIVDSLKFKKVNILAVVYTDHFNYTLKLRIDDPIIIFGCFDQIQLFFFYSDSQREFLYSAKLICCRNWGEKTIRAISLHNPADFLEITLKIENARVQGDYHYHICERTILPVLIKNNPKISELNSKIQCQLCFKLFNSKITYQNHLEIIHSNYDFSESMNSSVPKLKIDNNEKTDQLIISNHNENDENDKSGNSKGINFCSPISVVIESNSIFYVDFCSGISINFDDDLNYKSDNSESNSQNYEKTNNAFKISLDSIDKLQEVFVNSQSKPNISYYSFKTPIELANEIFKFKIQSQMCKEVNSINNNLNSTNENKNKSKSSHSTEISILFIRPFSLSRESKSQNKFVNSSKCYLNVSVNTPYQYLNNKYLKKSSNKNFQFFKNRSTSILKYELENYGLLVQREYNQIDYSDMLANYLNRRIDKSAKDGSIEEERYEIMKTWNKLFIQYGKVNDCLYNLLNTHGLSDPCIEMIELLYSRGLMTSNEIQIILKSIDITKNNKFVCQ